MTHPDEDEVRTLVRAQIKAYREQLPARFRPIWDELTGVRRLQEPVQPRPTGDRADVVPRRRNPHLWCEQIHGTWIHGDPHNCPRWARG